MLAHAHCPCLLGLRYLYEEFGVRPRTACQLDPFGYASLSPGVLSQMGSVPDAPTTSLCTLATEILKHTRTHRDRERETERDRDRGRDRERQRETERDRERQRKTEKDRETEKDRRRQRRQGETDRERDRGIEQ